MKVGLLRNYFHRVYIIHNIPFCRVARQTKCYGQNKQVYNYQYNMARNYGDNRLVWIDLEMTGLDHEKDKILEIACLITDTDLKLVAEGPDIIIHQPNFVLESMGDWCKEHHGESGLTRAVRESKITLEDAENKVLEFVKEHTKPQECLLAGNSVHVDKTFLTKYMPRLVGHLHYRIVDVSTVKELCKYWYPSTYKRAPCKSGSHRALDDIKESLAELKFYRSAIFT